jgi:AraC-like DNA-binding protein
MQLLNETWEGLAAQANYRPGALAKLCKVSLRTLQRHFAKNYSLTLGGWMRDIRLSAAYRRISNGEQIKAVAFDLGFKQLSHFSRVFKQVHGVPPRMVRRPKNAQAPAAVPAAQPIAPLPGVPPTTQIFAPRTDQDFEAAAAGLN